MAVKFNPKPQIGLFLKSLLQEGYSLIQVDGEEWIVETKHVKKLKEERC